MICQCLHHPHLILPPANTLLFSEQAKHPPASEPWHYSLSDLKLSLPLVLQVCSNVTIRDRTSHTALYKWQPHPHLSTLVLPQLLHLAYVSPQHSLPTNNIHLLSIPQQDLISITYHTAEQIGDTHIFFLNYE